jgi:glycine oxidase
VNADVVVVGGGLIGCATAATIADRGAKVILVTQRREGAASAAAAGLLAPSIDPPSGPARAIASAARDRYPGYLEQIRERTGVTVPLDRRGILHIAVSEEHAAQLRSEEHADVSWLDAEQVRTLEPALAPTFGAALAAHDGAVDNVVLLAALDRLISAHEAITTIDALVVSIDAGDRAAVLRTREQHSIGARDVVLCAGAWAGTISGAGYARAVEPVRGQLLSFDLAALGHAVYAPDVYLVPRANGCTLAGSTMEHVGFDPRTTESVVHNLTASARALCPVLPAAATAAWAGLRPVTPDLLPLIGRDPSHPALIYACGHSRNGVLLAPITAEIVARIVFEERLNFDLGQFDPARFKGTFTKP